MQQILLRLVYEIGPTIKGTRLCRFSKYITCDSLLLSVGTRWWSL